jgi:maltose alpha-D-glucosyltransferase/alpha-amylase
MSDMLDRNGQWYRKTIFYELHVRSFADGNGDGIGDFKGLIEHLGYIERLGIGALWLLPFYPSPLRDDGYDIANYMGIHPDYGTLKDFKRFLREAHDRGIRVVTELVLNHTSDQHPWFQRARKAKPGSASRNFYVWSETQDKFSKARIIFKDFEHSNWAWDPVAKSNYWHRFYSHQPDLNFESPTVRREMLKVVDHWLGMGVDGLRLDAVPYLYEREGTNCENLPETHAFLKELRSHVDAKFPGRMLLAEANQWPEDAVDYFGQGDECHMAFDFPVMPRIFMAMWMEDRYPIIDIVGQTPAIPEGCQWAVFLRNHDELTLEMVSDEERDYMYRAYARESKARINLGIRRRLAPLMLNNRRKMELINFLLFSFPGSPIIYYGDELGMGDNYHLGDRHGVRTPMQWSPDRNAGFSSANPQSLFLPVIIDPEYHYEVVNAETAERNQSSFLWWMRRLIAVYKTLPVLGAGDLTFVRGENTKVLSFLRVRGDERLLVVANLSRYAQVAELVLSALAGYTPVEVFGHTRFPVIRKEPYVLTIGPHDHFWFQLVNGSATSLLSGDQPVLSLMVDPESGVHHRENLAALESSLLPAALAKSTRGTTLPGTFRELRILDALPIKTPEPGATLFVVEGVQGQSVQNTHLLLVSVIGEKRLETFATDAPDAVLAKLAGMGGQKILADGFEDMEAVSGLAALLGSNRKYHGLASRFLVEAHASKSLRKDLAYLPGHVRLIHSTPHTVSYCLGNTVFLKFYRHPEEGSHPEVELLNILSTAEFPGAPRLLASLAYQRPRGDSMTLAVAMEYVQDAEEGAAFVLDGVDRYLEHVLAAGIAPPAPLPADPFTPPPLSAEQRELLGEYTLEFFRRLGQRTAQFHKILAGMGAPAFAPEPVTKFYLRSLYQAMRNLTHRTAQAVERTAFTQGTGESQPPRTLPNSLLLQHFARLLTMEPLGLRIRIHGDFQLDNVLHLGKDFMLVDFDGDVRVPVGERALKRSALRDVASMIFSIGVTAEKSLRRHLERNPSDREGLAPWLSLWRRTAILTYLTSYLHEAGGEAFLPQQDDVMRQLLMVFALEQSLRSLIRSLEEAPGDVPILLDMTDFILNLFP